MTSHRIPLALLVAAGLAVPASASATTYCVNASCADQRPTIQAALDAAKVHSGLDSVVIAPKPDGSDYRGSFVYTSSDPITITGTDGPPVVLQSNGGGPALTLESTAGSRVQDLQLSGGSSPGLVLTGAAAQDLTVRSDSQAAIRMRGAALSHVVATSRDGAGIEAAGAASTLVGTFTSGETGIAMTFTNLTAERSLIFGQTAGISSIGDADATRPALDLRTSIIATGAARSSGITLTDAHAAVISRSTIANTNAAADPSSSAITTSAPHASLDGFVRDSVLADYGRGFTRTAALGRAANLTVSHSEWDPGRDALSGAGAFQELGNSHTAPRLIDPAHDDFRLHGDDPAIDLTTQGPAPNVLDRQGRPALDGDGDGTATADAGASEYQRQAPQLTISGSSGGAAGSSLAFAAQATDPDGEAPAIRWSFGDGAGGAGAAVAHAFATPGSFPVTATATDDSGLKTTRTLTVTIAQQGGTSPAPSPSPSPSPGATPAPSATPEPTADLTPPALSRLRLKRRHGRAILKLRASEPARLALTFRHRRRTLTLAAGPARIGLGRLPSGRYRLRLRATDAAGNRSIPMKPRLRLR